MALAFAAPMASYGQTPSPTPSANDDAPAQILVTKLAPRAPMDPDEFFQVKGTITNRGSQPLAGIRVQLRRGEALRTRGELATADQEEPSTGRLVGTRVAPEDEELAPGASTTFDVRVRVALLRLSRAPSAIGVYPLKVEVRARFGDEGTDTVGAVQTFVPWFPDGPPRGRTRIAWVWPLVDQPRRGPREVMVDDQLARSVSRQGRLDTLLRAVAEGQRGRCDDVAQGPPDAAPRPQTQACRGESVPVTYAVDPDLLYDVDAMTSPYRLQVTPKRTREVTETEPFRTWLTTLRDAVAGADLLALPYADPDVVALTAPDTGLADEVGRLQQLGSREAERVTGREPMRSVVWPPAGRLTRSAVEALSAGGASAALLDPIALPETDSDSGRTPDAVVGQLGQATGVSVTGLVLDTGLSELLVRQYDDYPGARLAEQRWLVETAMIAAEAPSVSRTLVVAPPRRGELVAAVGAAALWDTGRLPWLCPVSLAAVAAGSDSCVGETTPEPREPTPAQLEPRRPNDVLLSSRYLRGVLAARRASTQLTDQVLAPGQSEAVKTTARLLRARARAESSAWRDNPADGEQMLDLLGDDLADLRGKVHLEVGRGTVTLTSRTGVISVNVVNELGQPVRVGVQLEAANRARLSLSEVPVETIPPGSSTQINLRVTSATSGQFAVRAQLVDRGGSPFGQTAELVVRSTQYGRVALAVTGVGAGVLLVAVGFRISRRALRRERTG